MDDGYRIQTTFYGPGTPEGDAKPEVKINLAKHPRSAVLRAIDHMQLNTYGAVACEVFDTNTNERHATIRRYIGEGNRIEIEYGRDPTKYILGGPVPKIGGKHGNH